MKALLLCYTLKKATPTQRTALQRELFGYKDYSNKGQYTYQRNGKLAGISYIRPTKSDIIIKEEDEPKVRKVLHQFNISLKTYKIQINQAEFAR